MKKVMIIEDDLDSRELFEECLSYEDLNIVEALHH